jgi:hypothetical protein
MGRLNTDTEVRLDSISQRKHSTFTTTTMAATKNDWSSSEAKKLLEDDLLAGKIPLDNSKMPTRVVYGLHPQFLEFPFNNFSQNLRNLRERIKGEKGRAEFDSAALACDLEHHRKPVVAMGPPSWHKSHAQQLLRQDMDNKLHTANKPEQFYATRPEYGVFSLEVFRKHIDQEVRRRKFLKTMKAKNAKKAKANR